MIIIIIIIIIIIMFKMLSIIIFNHLAIRGNEDAMVVSWVLDVDFEFCGLCVCVPPTHDWYLSVGI